MMNKKQRQREQILQHGFKLLRLFPDSGFKEEPVKLCKALFRIENRVHRRQEQVCNGEIDDSEAADKRDLQRVNEILGNENGTVPVFINEDPRGYALKIKSEWIRAHAPDFYRDMGGYGIIAPVITGE